MELRSLPREQVMQAWPDIAPVLAKIVGKDGREDLLDVAGSLLKGEYHALIVVDDAGAIACVCVAQFCEYRAGKVCHIVYIAGNRLTGWLQFVDSICEWCKAQGCISVEGTGRAGWERVLHPRGFTRMSSTIRKRL
ncbi:hypothetical protein A7J57_08660 [Agrobacterium tumefaciens]|uniref:GNAT family N-acetyltransferase n=1 Tax=Agrobacterium tumefaciens TaxID=358 RepID=A0A176WWV8_AGRTU|nr:hypothetical protein A7J57_08660 [Agrobacterium tumefaciens]